MNEDLRIVEHLYGESEPPVALDRDADLRAEYEMLRRVKRALDDRPPRRPDPRLVDRVVALAAGRRSTSAKSRDERPSAPGRAARWRRLFGIASAVVTTAFLMVVGVQQWVGSGGAEAEDARSTVTTEAVPQHDELAGSPDDASAETQPEQAGAPQQEDAQPAASPLESSGTAAGGDAVPEAVLAWDGPTADVVEAYRHIRLVQARTEAAPRRTTQWND